MTSNGGSKLTAKLSRISLKLENFTEPEPLTHPLSNLQAFIYYTKLEIEAGILTIARAFADVGMVLGTFSGLLITLAYISSAYKIIKYTKRLGRKYNRRSLSYAQLVEIAFEKGPQRLRKYSHFMRFFCNLLQLLTFFKITSVHCLALAKIFHNYVDAMTTEELKFQSALLYLMIPFILISTIGDMRDYPMFLLLSEGLMAVGVLLAMYFFIIAMPKNLNDRVTFGSFRSVPKFITTMNFQWSAITIIIPLENFFKKPKSAIRILMQGSIFVFVVYSAFGILGYLAYGEDTQTTIMFNLPKDTWGQAAQFLIVQGILVTLVLEFFVLMDVVETMWHTTKRWVDYIRRIFMLTLAASLLFAATSTSILIMLVGGVSLTILCMVLPAIVEILAKYDDGYGKWNHFFWKNVILIAFFSIIMIIGSIDTMEDLIKNIQNETNPTSIYYLHT